MKYLLLLLIFFSGGVFPDWNPDYLRKDFDKSVLEEKGFQKFKNRVLRAVENTWCSNQKANLLMDLVKLERPDVCVEIGVMSGDTFIPVAATLKYIQHGKAYAIDAWSNEEACLHLLDDDPNKPWYAQLDLYGLKQSYEIKVRKWKLGATCVCLPEPSRTAIHSLKTIDFLHIDGNYSEEGSLEDVRLYLPKVKHGGYILYSNIHWSANGRTPRIKAFQLLLESCEILADIDDRSTYLLRKL